MGKSEGVGEEEQDKEPKQTGLVQQLLQEVMSTVIPVCKKKQTCTCIFTVFRIYPDAIN